MFLGGVWDPGSILEDAWVESFSKLFRAVVNRKAFVSKCYEWFRGRVM